MHRYCPQRVLPPYAYVPGHRPHPQRDADGHSFGVAEISAATLRPDAWQQCSPYLWGTDLFNFGYYWEAHEAWEAVWVGAGRHGPVGAHAQGLIKLAAAALKIRLGQRAAARSLARAAMQHFADLAAQTGLEVMAGLSLHALQDVAEAVASAPLGDPRLTVQRVIGMTLRLGDTA